MRGALVKPRPAAAGRALRVGLAGAGAWLLAAAVPAVAGAHQFEPTVECAAGGSAPIIYRARTRDVVSPFECRLGEGQTDTYTFDGAAGETVRVLLSRLGFELEPRLRVRAPDGSLQLSSEACVGQGSPCYDTHELAPLEQTGPYQIEIASVDAGGEFDFYRLQLERVAPANYDPADLAIQGGRDFYADGFPIEPSTDVDHFGLEVTSDDQRKIHLTVEGEASLDPKEGGLDLVVELWDEAGIRLAREACDGGEPTDTPCRVELTRTVEAPGVYSFAVWDEGTDETGPYIYFWSLPEPEAGLQAGLVLAALALLRRSAASTARTTSPLPLGGLDASDRGGML